MGVVALELIEEFVRSWELTVWFADVRDAVDDELLEAIVTD
jgi:hypothetical protein